jgi:hypothetical protein
MRSDCIATYTTHQAISLLFEIIWFKLNVSLVMILEPK